MTENSDVKRMLTFFLRTYSRSYNYTKKFSKISKGVGKVEPKRKKYPNQNVTTQDVALFLEKGTTRHPFPNPHFKNTERRTRSDVKGIIEKMIKLKVK